MEYTEPVEKVLPSEIYVEYAVTPAMAGRPLIAPDPGVVIAIDVVLLPSALDKLLLISPGAAEVVWPLKGALSVEVPAGLLPSMPTAILLKIAVSTPSAKTGLLAVDFRKQLLPVLSVVSKYTAPWQTG